MFLRVRGNVKEMERELGLSYPTVRARLEEAFQAAGFPRETPRSAGDAPRWETRFEVELSERIRASVDQALSGLRVSGRRAERNADLARERTEIIGKLERGEITAADAAAQLRTLKERN
jgi:hypothetical protein